MVKTRAQSLRSLESAEKSLKKALSKSIVVDRKTKRGNKTLHKKARKELSMLRKSISRLRKALGKASGPSRKRRRSRRKRSKRRKTSKRRRTKRRRRR